MRQDPSRSRRSSRRSGGQGPHSANRRGWLRQVRSCSDSQFRQPPGATDGTPSAAGAVDLAATGRKLWRDTVAVYELRPDELPLLAEMARTVDDLEVMRAALREWGPLWRATKGSRVPNPLLTEIRGYRLVLARLAGQLGLPDEGVATSRTPAQRRASKASRARWGEAGRWRGVDQPSRRGSRPTSTRRRCPSNCVAVDRRTRVTSVSTGRASGPARAAGRTAGVVRRARPGRRDGAHRLPPGE